MKAQAILVLLALFAASLAGSYLIFSDSLINSLEKITLQGTIRDFSNHPDFGVYCCAVATGLVKTTLGADKTPEFNSVGNPRIL